MYNVFETLFSVAEVSGLLGDNSGRPVPSLNLGSRQDDNTYSPITDTAFERLYSCDPDYLATMLQDHYRVTNHDDSFVTSDDADDVIDSTGPGTSTSTGVEGQLDFSIGDTLPPFNEQTILTSFNLGGTSPLGTGVISISGSSGSLTTSVTNGFVNSQQVRVLFVV